jgi:hypothetical protein
MEKILDQILKNKGRASLVTTLVVSLLVLTCGFYNLITQPAKAASLTSVKDTLSTSAPATASNHIIQFITQTAIKNGDTIKIELDTLGTTDQFSIGAFTVSDIDFATSSSGTCSAIQTSSGDENINSSFTGGARYSVAISSSTDDITFTASSTAGTYVATSSCIVIRLGTNAIFQASGTNQITNPAKTAAVGTADVNDIKITFTGTPVADSGSALVATIEGVTVSVTVDASLTFTIDPVASSSCTQGGSATQVTTTTSTVPFGSSLVAVNTFYKGCHTLTISTNASSGYAVTTEENTNLLSGANTISDTICNGSTCDETPANAAAWSTATVNGFGYTCAGSDCVTGFSSGSNFAQFACKGTDAQCNPSTGAETQKTFMSSSTPVSNTTTTVVYKLSISGTQAAGSYSNTITYIATPTF